MPCPDWLEELCDAHGDDSPEVELALRRLDGKILYGRFDYCQLDFDGRGVELDRFDEEIYTRVPESPRTRLRRRERENIEECWVDPEIALDTRAAHYLHEVEECTTAGLMTWLETGPNGLDARRSIIFDRRMVNIFPTGDDSWAVEWPQNGDAIMLILDTPVPGHSDAAEGGDGSDDLESTGGVSGLGIGVTGDGEDTSLNDYLTEEDSYENHLALTGHAISQGLRLSILYGDRNDEPTARSIQPVRIVDLNRLYVLAWDELREDWRTFRLDRFKMCDLRGPHFSPREVPLPEDMKYEDLERIKEDFGEDVDNATVRVAWSLRFRS